MSKGDTYQPVGFRLLAAVRRWQALNNFDVVQAAMSWSGLSVGLSRSKVESATCVITAVLVSKGATWATATMRRIAIGRSDRHRKLDGRRARFLRSEGISIAALLSFNMLSDSAFEKPETAA